MSLRLNQSRRSLDATAIWHKIKMFQTPLIDLDSLGLSAINLDFWATFKRTPSSWTIGPFFFRGKSPDLTVVCLQVVHCKVFTLILGRVKLCTNTNQVTLTRFDRVWLTALSAPTNWNCLNLTTAGIYSDREIAFHSFSHAHK